MLESSTSSPRRQPLPVQLPLLALLLAGSCAGLGADATAEEQPRHSEQQPPSCPTNPAPLGWACPEESLSAELLADPFLADAGTSGPWHLHSWQQGGASIESTSGGGAVLNVSGQPKHEYDIILYQSLALNTSASYELCVQAGAAGGGSGLRFAVDGGEELEFEVAGGGAREHLAMDAAQALGTACFRFTLRPRADSRYPARVALEFGAAAGALSVCHVSLRRCIAPTGAGSLCPATLQPLDAWRCPEELLGDELLSDSGFAGLPGMWGTSMWEDEGAAFSWGMQSPGVLVDVKEHQDAELYDVLLFQTVPLNASSGASYELCVQASGAHSGDQLRFAVDGGQEHNFVTAGGGVRRTYMELQAGELVTSCFRFTLEDSAEAYPGRVAIEMGQNLGQVGVCHASLRRCNAHTAARPEPLRRCYIAPLVAGSSCERLEALSGQEFGLNKFEQETTGARRCLDRLRDSGGDTFSFGLGQCELWRCKSRDALFASATGDDAEDRQIFSQFCQYQEPEGGRLGKSERRSPVFLQLMEWSYLDVAKECEEYLGPNGFDGVQVSPVTEHLLGASWWTRYQPVSFKLDSRSGTSEEFREMVARCREAGVEVIVDVILNHMAKPCDAVRKVGDGAGMPCYGWSGSKFGNRRVGGVDGWPLMTPDNFHHLADDALRNCGVDDLYQCPDSVPANDCSMCDLYGLPDWKTEDPDVQEMLWKHVEELHDIGVTMLRIDAASYMHVEDLAGILSRAPWNFVVQEWWGGVPEPRRSLYVGHYRDYRYGSLIKEVLEGDASQLHRLLNLSSGQEGVPEREALGSLTDHDQKDEVSYKAGLAFHQWQKWMLAWPKAFSLRLFSGYGWATSEDGPPGCELGNVQCQPERVFSGAEPQCMRTPTRSPLDLGLSDKRAWVCEHRWGGIAGLVAFRKACRGLPITQTWLEPEKGRLAFRAGDVCFGALQKGYDSRDRNAVRHGDWSLAGQGGLSPGLPPGRYCDMASLPTQHGWARAECPREVTVAEDGKIIKGEVPEGDVLAIYTGGLLSGDPDDEAPSAAVWPRWQPLLLALAALLAALPHCTAAHRG